MTFEGSGPLHGNCNHCGRWGRLYFDGLCAHDHQRALFGNCPTPRSKHRGD